MVDSHDEGMAAVFGEGDPVKGSASPLARDATVHDGEGMPVCPRCMEPTAPQDARCGRCGALTGKGLATFGATQAAGDVALEVPPEKREGLVLPTARGVAGMLLAGALVLAVGTEQVPWIILAAALALFVVWPRRRAHRAHGAPEEGALEDVDLDEEDPEAAALAEASRQAAETQDGWI